MCGIHAVISQSAAHELSPEIERCLRNRGPDHIGSVTIELPLESQEHGNAGLFLTLTSTVLSLRGDHVARQPLVDSNGSVLCWNGEAWKIDGKPVLGNDGEAIVAMLANVGDLESRHEKVLECLRQIEGPFAFVYFDKPGRRLYFARDRLGRRSLLHKPGWPFCFASVADPTAAGWCEVEADGCYSIDLGDECLDTAGLIPSKWDWVSDNEYISSIGPFNESLPSDAEQSRATGQESLPELRQHLYDSLELRLLDVPPPPQAQSSDSRVAILFSGGLDCSVLARLANDLVPAEQAIDLINVAFENPRIAAQYQSQPDINLYELCPDRITGRKSFAELREICPSRSWHFVTVNVPFEETKSHRAQIIRLIYPHATEMDLSIACALYFAARGEGQMQTHVNAVPVPYSTKARVLLSGLGADELFGGYSRHSAAFTRDGYPGLVEELKLDVSRLGKRNLGRDDRVMAHWGREVRFPYLDENFARWAIQLSVREKCDFGDQDEGQLEPGKRLLRRLAEELGMKSVAREKKRAIQFGARTAKMESGKVKGTTTITA